MIKQILITSFLALTVAACGGSSGGSNNNNGGGNNAGGNGGGDGNSGAVGGQSGSFGDTADAANGADAMSQVCPASVTGSFTGWAENGGSWCVWKCPATATIVNEDGDEWGFISASGETCRATTAAAGTVVVAPLFAALNGCPTGGCTDGSQTDFPRVLITQAAGAELAGNYQCKTWTFNGTTDLWSEDTTQSTFSLDLADDFSTSNGTWSFSAGTLNVGNTRTLNNVAVGSGKFTSWNSNTSLVRCES